MQDMLESVAKRLEAQRADPRARAEFLSRSYKCRCGRQVVFRNLQCVHCDAKLGFIPDEGKVVPLAPGPRPGTWTAPGRDDVLKFCANRNSPAACSWMVFARNPREYCIACRLNRTIPHLQDADNARYWGAVEIAKRRLVSQLIALGLPVRSKLEDPERGLMFDFLRAPQGEPQVMTGHASGLITINVEEADDAKREHMRHAMREPYRTLLGHFRHEVGHYYWDRLIWDSKWLEPCRTLFGDERASYADALKRNYEQGPPADWAQRCISAYATMHPWEDWAETWAHYLHVVDSLEMAAHCGLSLRPRRRDEPSLPAPPPVPARWGGPFEDVVDRWLPVAYLLNNLNRGLGHADAYPFV